MRILVLNADYPRFLSWLYRRQPGLENASYETQMAARNASLFGCRRLLLAEFRRPGPPFGGDPRQQSLASGGMGTRARDGRRNRGAFRHTTRHGASSLDSARRDAAKTDAAAVGPQGWPRVRAHCATAMRSDTNALTSSTGRLSNARSVAPATANGAALRNCPSIHRQECVTRAPRKNGNSRGASIIKR